METRDVLKNSAYLKYLKSLKPEQIAKRYFVANNNAKWTDDIADAKAMKTRDNKNRFPYAISFIGESSSFLNGLIVHQLLSQLPNNLKVNAVAVAEDVDKFLAENEAVAMEIITDIGNTHDYAVNFCLEMLKTYGKGLAYIRTSSNNHGI